MNRKEMIDSALEHLRARSGVKTVYGQPVEINGKTIIPVAKVTLAAAGPGLKPHESREEVDQGPVGAATGNGSGAGIARPVGVVEITDEETRFVSFGQTKRLAIATAVGSGLGVILGWMLGRRHDRNT